MEQFVSLQITRVKRHHKQEGCEKKVVREEYRVEMLAAPSSPYTCDSGVVYREPGVIYYHRVFHNRTFKEAVEDAADTLRGLESRPCPNPLPKDG